MTTPGNRAADQTDSATVNVPVAARPADLRSRFDAWWHGYSMWCVRNRDWRGLTWLWSWRLFYRPALISKAMQQRCRQRDNCWMTPATRWLLTLKTIICIILRRELIGAFAITDYPLVVAVLASGSHPDYEFGQTIYWCESLCTFYGWRNWQYCIAGDSSL